MLELLLHNYFDDPTKLFSNLAIFLNTRLNTRINSFLFPMQVTDINFTKDNKININYVYYFIEQFLNIWAIFGTFYFIQIQLISYYFYSLAPYLCLFYDAVFLSLSLSLSPLSSFNFIILEFRVFFFLLEQEENRQRSLYKAATVSSVMLQYPRRRNG